MSSDGSVSRSRLVSRPKVEAGPLGRLKQGLYELYLTVQPMTLVEIGDRIRELADGDEVSDPTATPTTDTIRLALTDSKLPSPHHVVAIAAALLNPRHLPGTTPVVRGNAEVEHFRDLWKAAAAYKPVGARITEVGADDLEVHRAVDADQGLPAYIRRPHDEALDEVVRAALDGCSGIAVLISGSTSGKTRACYEAMHRTVNRGKKQQSLASAGWRVWPRINPLPSEVFLEELDMVGPRTVVWLNEAQRYLVESDKRIGAALRALLVDESRRPVLLLGTLWPDYYNTIMRRPSSPPDPYDTARALINGRVMTVPDTFSGEAFDAVRASTDSRLREAAEYDNAITQYLAGVPALMDRYAHATVPARAVLHAAMDARRLGHSERLPLALLHHAAPAYLDQREQREHLVDPGWFDRALEELVAPHAAKTRLLYPPPVFADQQANSDLVLEDYLDHHGRQERREIIPPGGFWDAVIKYASSPVDHHQLGLGAREIQLEQVALKLLRLAAENGVIAALGALIWPVGLKFCSDDELMREIEWAIRHALQSDDKMYKSFLVAILASSKILEDQSGRSDFLSVANELESLNQVDFLKKVGDGLFRLNHSRSNGSE